MGDLCGVAMVAQAFHLLTCPDKTIRSISENALQSIVQKKLLRNPSDKDTANYLSGCLEDAFSRTSGDTTTLWSRARNAT